MRNKLTVKRISGFFSRTLLLFVLLVQPLAHCLAQAATAAAPEPEMADGLRQSGKIYVVVASVVIIVGGLLAYLVSLDRKVSRLEKQSSD